MTDPDSPPPSSPPAFYAPPTLPAPIPALAYSIPMHRQRPGVLTAIGVMSIVIACFSALASLMTGCQAAGYYMVATMSRTMASSSSTSFTMNAPSTSGAGPNATSSGGTFGGPSGLGAADRQVALSTLGTIQTLNPSRKAQLDNYLATEGSSIFPTGGSPLTAQRVRIGVTSSYAHQSTATDDPGDTVFVTSWGTLKIYDTRADFLPSDGSAARSFIADSSSEVPATPDPLPPAHAGNAPATPPVPSSPSSGTALTPAEVQGAIQKAQQASGNKLNAAQVTSLTTALQDPNQQLITPGTAWSPIRSANVAADGSAWVMFTAGYVSLDPQGQMTTNNMGMPKLAVSNTACILAILDGLVGIGLAIFLFIAGISVLGQSNAGRRLHRIFALLKIPLCLAGTAALCWMNYQFYSSFSAMTPGGGSMRLMMFGWGAFVGGLGLIYPIALLITLRSRSVRSYYESVNG